MIENINIKGLFGSFDYDLSLPQPGNYLIITGPNGYGKTTLLKIIDALSVGDLLSLYDIPFAKISVKFPEGCLQIDSEHVSPEGVDDIPLDSERELRLYFQDAPEITISITSTIINTANQSSGSLYSLPSISSKGYWKDLYFDNDDEFEESTVTKRKELLKKIVAMQAQDAFLIRYNATLQDSRICESNRLYNKEDSERPAIEAASADIKNYLRDNYISFLQNSQKRDSSFIDTLLTGSETITESDYYKRRRELEEIIDNAKRYDLINNFTLPDYIADKAVILRYYIDESEKKLSVYDKPLKELSLFTELVNKKRMVNKRLRVNRRSGISFESNSGVRYIPLEKLSSGEQHEIVLLHDFIFNLPDGSLLLVDEPEISLHVAWQHEFMNDLQRIAKQKNLIVIIATHSPQIIGERWDECYDLKEETDQ